jgi:hypothetical protein
MHAYTFARTANPDRSCIYTQGSDMDDGSDNDLELMEETAAVAIFRRANL